MTAPTDLSNMVQDAMKRVGDHRHKMILTLHRLQNTPDVTWLGWWGEVGNRIRRKRIEMLKAHIEELDERIADIEASANLRGIIDTRKALIAERERVAELEEAMKRECELHERLAHYFGLASPRTYWCEGCGGFRFMRRTASPDVLYCATCSTARLTKPDPARQALQEQADD